MHGISLVSTHDNIGHGTEIDEQVLLEGALKGTLGAVTVVAVWSGRSSCLLVRKTFVSEILAYLSYVDFLFLPFSPLVQAIVLLCLNTCLPFVSLLYSLLYPVQSVQLHQSLHFVVTTRTTWYLLSGVFGLVTCLISIAQLPILWSSVTVVKLITFIRIGSGRLWRGVDYMRGARCWPVSKNPVQCFKNFHLFLPSPVLPCLSIIFQYSPFSFLILSWHWSLVRSYPASFISLAILANTWAFRLHPSSWAWILSSPQTSINFSAVSLRHPTPLFSRSRMLDSSYRLALASSRQLPNGQSASWWRTARAIGSAISQSLSSTTKN